MKKLLLIFCNICIIVYGNAQVQLWGMTPSGGNGGYGVIFQYVPGTNTFVKKLDFGGTISGQQPFGTLMKASDGKLYGTTYNGGTLGNGSLFQYDPVTNVYVNKYSFTGSLDGQWPRSDLMQATDGNLYGMTYKGGASNMGVVFQFNPKTNVYTKKIDFNQVNGQEGYGSLLQANDGTLYGMTRVGGLYSAGVIFQFNPKTNIYTKKFDFWNATDGIGPLGTLIQGTDGMLYGLCSGGGLNSSGVLFQFNPITNTFINKFDFSTANGSYPMGSLIQASDGMLYGTAREGGANGGGVLFQYNPITNIYTRKVDFGGTISGNTTTPWGSLLQASDGMLYGMTTYGGSGTTCSGVLFQFNPSSEAYSEKVNFIGANGCKPFYNNLIELNSGLGVANIAKTNKIVLFPNPNNGFFTIDLKAISQISITNTLGQLIFKKIMQSGNQNIDIQNQAEGVYFVKIITQNKQIITRLIKK